MPHYSNAASSLASIGGASMQSPNGREETESSQENSFTNSAYPWWEEQQCVLDSESSISDLEHSIKEQLQVEGWILDEHENENSASPLSSDVDAVILSCRYIPAFENWLLGHVEDPEDIDPIDGDLGP